ncbi:GAF domain-containing protein, partial [bacterium]|nr:GAF domain-containing protein [bacterium]
PAGRGRRSRALQGYRGALPRAKTPRIQDVVSTSLKGIPHKLDSIAPRERVLCDRSGIRALLVAPVILPDGTLGGLLGAHDVVGPRDWTEDDVRVLRTAAEMVSYYFARHPELYEES